MKFAAQHRAGRPGRDNSLTDKHLHPVKRSRPGVGLCLLVLVCAAFSVVPARAKPVAGTNSSAPASSSPSRKAAIMRHHAGTLPRIQTRPRLNLTVPGRPGEVAQSDLRALLQNGNEPQKNSDASPGIRAGFGRIFAEKAVPSMHPNDQRLEDRSWLYVKMNVKF